MWLQHFVQNSLQSVNKPIDFVKRINGIRIKIDENMVSSDATALFTSLALDLAKTVDFFLARDELTLACNKQILPELM